MPVRTSSIQDQLIQIQAPDAEWGWVNNMRSLIAVPQSTEIAAHLGIADVSCLSRFGVKGANAAAWLTSQSIPVPSQPNTWCALESGGLVARLGLTEFLLEDNLDSNLVLQLVAQLQDPPVKVYPVLRQDLAIALIGSRVPDLLRQTCSINFQAYDLSTHPVILTTMIGVAVTIIPGTQNFNQPKNIPYYRIWCDGTFGNYLWSTLLRIIQEMNGGVIGVNDLLLGWEYQ